MPRLDTAKFAVVYPRQSTAEQVQDNVYSLERQLQLRGKAAGDGFAAEQILVVDDDLGLSGGRIDKRPGFSRALKMIEQGLVAAIYVEDLTRLSRDERTIDQMRIADACEQSGTLIYMGGSWYDMRDAGGRMSYKYQAIGFSEYWRSHLGKLKSAREEKAAQGKAATQLPRGYRPNKTGHRRDADYDRPVVHEPEAEVIRMLVARLPEAGSLGELYRLTHPVYWPDGAKLSKNLLIKMMHNPILRGHYVYGKMERRDNHEAIITPDQAAMIDHLLATNRVGKRGDAANPMGVLAGLVWCPACGHKMECSSGGHSPAYRCRAYNPSGSPVFHFQLGLDLVDDMVMGDFWPRVGEVVEAAIAHLQGQQHEVTAGTDHGETQRRTIQRRIDGLMKSLADPDLEGIARKLVGQQLEEAGRQLEEMGAATPRGQHLAVDLAFFRDLVANPQPLELVHMTWDETPVPWRRKWLRHFIERVDLDEKGGMVVRYKGGVVASLSRGAYHYGQEEWAIIRGIYLDPARPKRGWCEAIVQELRRQGHERTRSAVYHAVAVLRKDG